MGGPPPKPEGEPPADDADLDDDYPEKALVNRWRYDQLRESGYPDYDAFLLARLPHVDIHEAADLLARGASVQTALNILL